MTSLLCFMAVMKHSWLIRDVCFLPVVLTVQFAVSRSEQLFESSLWLQILNNVVQALMPLFSIAAFLHLPWLVLRRVSQLSTS